MTFHQNVSLHLFCWMSLTCHMIFLCWNIFFYSCHSINWDVHPVLSRCHDPGVPAARAVTAQLCTQSAHCKVTHPRIRREFAAALSPGRLSVFAVLCSGPDWGECSYTLARAVCTPSLHWLSAQLAPTREGGLAWLACPHPRARIAIFKSGREWHQNNGRNNAK